MPDADPTIASRPRRPISAWEILSLGVFGVGALVMSADYVAVEVRPARDLAGYAPWYISNLALLGSAFVVAFWFALRRWLGAWAPLLAYLLFIIPAVDIVKTRTEERVESIPLKFLLSTEEIQSLERTIGERILQRAGGRELPRLLIRRDPQVHEDATRWLKEHGQQ